MARVETNTQIILRQGNLLGLYYLFELKKRVIVEGDQYHAHLCDECDSSSFMSVSILKII